ncbi:MAG: MaoC family dehydratase N-terminal domain-containing protein [Xanthobacteraceae bacterium]|nr:MaoC family dehydratase N-terminal domain-containing protein [Xanthobacteraceae bacterium]
MPDQTASLKEWLGRSRKEDDDLAVGSVRRLAAMLDQDPTPFKRGVEIPESWYAVLFGPTAVQSKIGRDGHPLTGDDLLPPLPNTRRMFAGRRVRFHKPLRVGDMVERVSTIKQVEPKTGRTGSFVLVTVVHEMSAGAGVAITEEQDLVYREDVAVAGAAAKPAVQAKPPAATEKADHAVEWKPDTVQLFRYSALTYNAHRIHYDLPYTREVEGYPALVINGGLIALMLVEAARPTLRGTVAGYDARAMAPMFIGQSVKLSSRIVGDTAETWAETWAESAEGGVHYRVNIALKRN